MGIATYGTTTAREPRTLPRSMTYEIINGWIVGKLPGPNGDLIPVKHFPQGPYERRQRNNPLLCLHTTETDGYVEDLRFPTEFQVGEDVIGQHRPLWARGAGVDEHDHDLLQIEIVGFSKLDRWLPKPSSLPRSSRSWRSFIAAATS